ncbi:MAG: hypothetical protein LUH04_12185, partial [Clostridium sp.]|nr:hypothetical protein [Clostridium sp.]
KSTKKGIKTKLGYKLNQLSKCTDHFVIRFFLKPDINSSKYSRQSNIIRILSRTSGFSYNKRDIQL